MKKNRKLIIEEIIEIIAIFFFLFSYNFFRYATFALHDEQ